MLKQFFDNIRPNFEDGGKLKAFREEKERREIEELNRLAHETEV